MKFGLESEKFIFDLHKNEPSSKGHEILKLLPDLSSLSFDSSRICSELVESLIEINSIADSSPIQVLRDYLSQYTALEQAASSLGQGLVSLGALPMEYDLQMLPEVSYYYQNCILSRRLLPSFSLSSSSPLRPAGNCSGMHVHAEIETPVADIHSNNELVDKFNMGLMLTPLIAFSSSPYFFGKHEAYCMRGIRYYQGVYQRFPLNGGLPPVMNSSQEILDFIQQGENHWLNCGESLGIAAEKLSPLIQQKGAQWNPVRWNKRWNTIELRCLDSDRLDRECAKFIWACAAFKRLSLSGEALGCQPLPDHELSQQLIDDCFCISDGAVTVLNNRALAEIFQRSLSYGLNDLLVQRYLLRLGKFARLGMSSGTEGLFDLLTDMIQSRLSTAELILQKQQYSSIVNEKEAIEIVLESISSQPAISSLLSALPPLSYNSPFPPHPAESVSI